MWHMLLCQIKLHSTSLLRFSTSSSVVLSRSLMFGDVLIMHELFLSKYWLILHVNQESGLNLSKRLCSFSTVRPSVTLKAVCVVPRLNGTLCGLASVLLAPALFTRVWGLVLLLERVDVRRSVGEVWGNRRSKCLWRADEIHGWIEELFLCVCSGGDVRCTGDLTSVWKAAGMHVFWTQRTFLRVGYLMWHFVQTCMRL